MFYIESSLREQQNYEMLGRRYAALDLGSDVITKQTSKREACSFAAAGRTDERPTDRPSKQGGKEASQKKNQTRNNSSFFVASIRFQWKRQQPPRNSKTTQAGKQARKEASNPACLLVSDATAEQVAAAAAAALVAHKQKWSVCRVTDWKVACQRKTKPKLSDRHREAGKQAEGLTDGRTDKQTDRKTTSLKACNRQAVHSAATTFTRSAVASHRIASR